MEQEKVLEIEPLLDCKPEGPGKYHYYDRIEDYRKKPFYSVPADESSLLEELRKRDEHRERHRYHQWVP